MLCDMDDLRFGILGAARIAPPALVRPAARVPGATVAGIAARDPQRARAFADKHGIATVHTSYDDLIADPDIDVVYNPLPNALHADWTLRALAAGKHVLCEKPFASNEDEARKVADTAEASGLVVMEAFHYRYHALAQKMLEAVESGRLGEVQSVRTWLCFPLPKFSDIRFDYALGGGALMDCCYTIHALRLLGPGEPEVVSARAKVRGGLVDRAMTAQFRFPGGATGRIDASMWSWRVLRVAVEVVGDRGELHATNFVAPQLWNRLVVKTPDGTTRERVQGEPTYDAQLRAFIAAVREGEPVLTPPADAVRTMRLIDDVYRAAGLPVRGDATVSAGGE
jgi:predicted dehydrogenase